MKIIFILIPIFASCLVTIGLESGNAGQILYPNMYSKFTLVQGTGETVEEAKLDAESSVPYGYRREMFLGYGQTFGCTISDWVLIRSDPIRG